MNIQDNIQEKIRDSGSVMLQKLVFRLLPIQILTIGVGMLNGMISSYFATNFLGVDAMSAVGVYWPVSMLVGAVSIILTGGCSILCGRYLGQNDQEKLQENFSTSLLLAAVIAVIFIVSLVIMGAFNLTGFLVTDEAVRPLFNQYLLGQAFGVLPLMLGNQMPVYLLTEHKEKLSVYASIVYVIASLVLNFLLVYVLQLGIFGLALASSVGLWILFAVQAQYFFTGSSHLKIKPGLAKAAEMLIILSIGLPGALSNLCQSARGLIVNKLIEAYVGSDGVSAFAAANNMLAIFWAVPLGMVAVSRMLIGVSIGEEDRQTLTDLFRIMFRRFVPIQCLLSIVLSALAVPLTLIFFKDPSEPVYDMTVWAFRLLPLCMPFSVICMHFIAYAQASGKNFLVNLLSVLDGVVCVAGFTALLIRSIGMNSAYIANILNGVVTDLTVLVYSIFMNRRFPKTMDELMVIPEDFGAPAEDRLDLSVREMHEVVTISRQVQDFCLGKGIDERRSYLSGLVLEEMAGNIVDHGYTKDKKSHTIDVRVVYKNDDIILRIKDDCVPFDPGTRKELRDPSDPAKNIGIRMIYQ
ncbi:MAG: ATP-binding protein, partial [Lachnospiraceae bacterium]|nr:ATP-binding protein [Lachnospiraceae bacterium]